MKYLVRDNTLSGWLVAAIIFTLLSYGYTLIWGWI